MAQNPDPKYNADDVKQPWQPIEEPVEMEMENRSKESDDNSTHGSETEEPELHLKTYIALAAMFLMNLVQIVALQGPPTVVSYHTIVCLRMMYSQAQLLL